MEIPALGRINITNNPPDINNLTDWERVKSMGDLEIEANALSDPDALPFDDDWENAAIISAYNKLTSQ
ncbi:MAG: hypothetical protein ACK4YL_10875 [Microcystis sp.]|jgi:hypothetical protein|uniref:Uncharacterized protein n=3 Tax=Microcystis aeruginosa TaxID=1126 RepID=A0A6H9FSU7_MICAE|nr:MULTISPECIES: hypothetical protein [Microcystis]MCZ8053262.1 hypothetical protein [Microcystis sp. LE19-12.2C]NCR74997.1 hypothetical protein [Microcystis aeruginosa K13-06]MCA2667784.1 hypothetical protein [Microcystis sp. M045S2]MCA2715352.1 hypothetical protein [Microcystis sp. M172S2]MCA2716971.1 hypothetical protein [Microcystis sp. M169S2]